MKTIFSHCFLILCLPFICSAAEVDGTRPNIVFMLSDDMGWNEVGFNGGNPDHTPNLDHLRKSGMSCTQFYTHSVCAPTRAAFLTGRYAFRTWSDWRSEDFGKPSYLEKLGMKLVKNKEGEWTRRIHALPTEEITVAESLKDAGYYTAIIGKWHCGEWLPEHLPMGQGFMHQYGHYAWGIDYNNYTIPHNAPARFAVYDWHRNQEPLYEQGYSTDLFANETVRLIAEHRKKQEQTGKEQPFFIYVPFNAVHGPLEEVPRYTDKYGKRHAALKCLDDAVGRIVGAVDQYGFKENTLVIFSNDNGGLRESMNAPYRGTKNTTYEGGVRVPFVMRWPKQVPKNSSHDGMMHIVDLYNTFITLGDGEIPVDRVVDGMNMTETLFNSAKSPRHEIILEVEGSVRLPTIRSGDYKLVGSELYHIIDDPSETTDLSKQHPKIVKQLKAKLAKASSERPPMPKMDQLMSPAQPWVYGQEENKNVPQWLKDVVSKVRATQPQSWAPGKTPWPQAPKGGKIIYSGDGR